MLQQMADVRAEIEATRRVTRDRTRQLAMLDTATRRVQDVQDRVDRVVQQGAVELESAPASDATAETAETAETVQLSPPPPSPIRNTHAPTQQLAVLTLAAPGAAPDSDATDDAGDRQPEMDAIMARTAQSSFEDRADAVTLRLEDLPEAQRVEARRVIGHVTAMRTMSRIGLAIMQGDDMNAETVVLHVPTVPITPVTPNTPWINLQMDLRYKHAAMPKSNPTSNLAAPGTCSICKEAQSCVVFTGCGHVCTCVTCANTLKEKKCPICRKKGSTLPVYMP